MYPGLLGKTWLRVNHVVSNWSRDCHFIRDGHGRFILINGAVPEPLLIDQLGCLQVEYDNINDTDSEGSNTNSDSSDDVSESNSSDLNTGAVDQFLVLISKDPDSNGEDTANKASESHLVRPMPTKNICKATGPVLDAFAITTENVHPFFVSDNVSSQQRDPLTH